MPREVCPFIAALGLALGCTSGQRAADGNDQSCGQSALRLNVRIDGSGALPSAQLLVVWATPGVEANPQVAYQVPFTGRERALCIPFDELALPATDALYLAMQCDSDGLQCRPNPVAAAYVVVTAATETAASLETGLLGAAPVMIGFAEHAVAKGERVLSQVFPGGMREGMSVYTRTQTQGRRFEQLWPASPGTAFELLVCAPGAAAACDPPVPNIN